MKLTVVFIALAALDQSAVIRRLSVRAFPSVPPPVRRTVEAERCSIPQPVPSDANENIVRGHFRSRTRIDYAVLCSRDGEATVLVVNGVTGAIMARLGCRPEAIDVAGLGTVRNGHDEYGYGRRLETAAPDPKGFCFEDYARDCPCKGSPYEGIVDGFETHCWRNGWHTVTSGD